MSKAFTAAVIKHSTACNNTTANAAAGALLVAIVKEMKQARGLHLTLVRHLPRDQDQGAQGTDPKTGAAIKIKAGQNRPLQGQPDPEEGRLTRRCGTRRRLGFNYPVQAMPWRHGVIPLCHGLSVALTHRTTVTGVAWLSEMVVSARFARQLNPGRSAYLCLKRR